MATLDVFDLNNKKVSALDVSDAVFGAPKRPWLLAEVVHWQRAKRRSGTHSTLSRGEVSGTTKKPFPQKGRGMARQGDMKGPHLIGGGVAFGPKPRDYGYRMPKAKKRAALAEALSCRVRENSLKVLSEFSLSEAKTKVAASALEKLGSQKALVVDCENGSLKRSMRNLKDARFIDECGLNVYDILRYPVLMMTERAVKVIEKRMLGEVEKA